MSWIPVPPLTLASDSYSYPATFGSPLPPVVSQQQWLLPVRPKEEIFPEEKTPHLQPVIDKCTNQIFIGELLSFIQESCY